MNKTNTKPPVFHTGQTFTIFKISVYWTVYPLKKMIPTTLPCCEVAVIQPEPITFRWSNVASLKIRHWIDFPSYKPPFMTGISGAAAQQPLVKVQLLWVLRFHTWQLDRQVDAMWGPRAHDARRCIKPWILYLYKLLNNQLGWWHSQYMEK